MIKLILKSTGTIHIQKKTLPLSLDQYDIINVRECVCVRVLACEVSSMLLEACVITLPLKNGKMYRCGHLQSPSQPHLTYSITQKSSSSYS